METFGEYLRNLRKSKKITLKQLAAALGVSIAYIHQLETGKSPPPTLERCRQLVKALDADFDDLWKRACNDRVMKSLDLDDISDHDPRPMVLTATERRLIKLVRALDSDTRFRLMGSLREIILNHPNDIMLILIADLLDIDES